MVTKIENSKAIIVLGPSFSKLPYVLNALQRTDITKPNTCWFLQGWLLLGARRSAPKKLRDKKLLNKSHELYVVLLVLSKYSKTILICCHSSYIQTYIYTYSQLPNMGSFTYYRTQTNLTVIKTLNCSVPQAPRGVSISLGDCRRACSDCFTYLEPSKKLF